jgi:beta-N-acetylhexosaminidase
VARDSFTLLYPDPASAADVVSVAPQSDDSILIFTDSRLIRECERCIAETAVGPDDLAEIIKRLYGPEGTGQLTSEQIVSLTFSDLAQLLESEQEQAAAEEDLPDSGPAPIPTETPTATPITDTPDQSEGATPLLPVLDKNAKMNLQIQEADWIIFAMLDVDTARYPNSDVLKRFLRQRGNQLANKHLAVLALHAPYFLDATEISKLNGYYGVYSRTQPFLESAVRGLFRAFSPTGAPPVSVPGTRFGSLAERLAPDPARPVDLHLLSPEGRVLAGEDAAEGAAPPVVEAGQMVRIQAGPVIDRNGALVRNGTPVELTLAYPDSPEATEVLVVTTQNGMAVRDVVVNRGGMVRVSARAGDAVSAEDLSLSVQAPVAMVENGAVLSPTMNMSSAQVTGTEAVSQAETMSAAPVAGLNGRRINLGSLAVALFTMLATSSLLLVVQVRVLPRQHLVHSLLWAVNCGLAGYILYGLGLVPGGSWLQGSLQVWGAGLVVFIAMLLPLVWLQLRMN